MKDLKPAMYALGLVEGYIEGAIASKDPGAEEALEAIGVVDRTLKEMSAEYLELQMKIMQIQLLVNQL